MKSINLGTATTDEQSPQVDRASNARDAALRSMAESADRKTPHSIAALAAKRAIDIVLTATFGLLVLPLLAAIAVAIKCSSQGPIFYGQVRVGRDGQRFRMWKFRTMYQDAEQRLDEYLTDNPELLEEWAAHFKLEDDPRVIPWIGGLLRRSSLDEFPQLWNVLVGEMSLVGPRPLPQYHFDHFDDEFRHLRCTLPPGITGLWQVCSRNKGGPEMFQKWDTCYVRDWSLWLDFRILIRTLGVIFGGK